MSLAEEVLARRVLELEARVETLTEMAVQRENYLTSVEKELQDLKRGKKE
jgi:hypothetical protein